MNGFPLRHIPVFLMAALALLGCGSPSDISGRLTGVEKEGAKVYLIQPHTLREVAASYFGKIIDSAVVSSDGSFGFTHLPPAKGPVLLEMALQQPGKLPNYLNTDDPTTSNYMPLLWEAGSPLRVSSDYREFQKRFAIEDPSEANRALLELRDLKLKAYTTYLKDKEWHVEDGQQLMEKEDAVLHYRKQLMDFADTTEHLVPALVALRWVSPEDDYERVPEFLVDQCHRWEKEYPEHPWVVQLCQRSKPAGLPVLVGDEFPDLQLPTLARDTVRLHDQLGEKLTVIDLWASWCAPCRTENRKVLVPLWDRYHDKGLQIVAYGLESNETAWKGAIERDGAHRWLQASDLQGDDAPFLKGIRVTTIPANFILDSKGIVLAKNVHGQALVDYVKAYLEKN